VSSTPDLNCTPLRFPFTVYQTKNKMNDYRADDMRYGDLSEFHLKEYFGLREIVEGVNPYTSEVSRYPSGNYSFARPAIITEKRSHEDIAAILFDQFRRYSAPVSFMGYRKLFIRLVDHLQTGRGEPFNDELLDKAYHQQIVGDKSKESSLEKIKRVIKNNIDLNTGAYPASNRERFGEELSYTVLPRFDRWVDRVNGLGISVHGIYATHITMISLLVEGNAYTATIHYRGQDHFGLDDIDIMDLRFHNLPIFRIWFLLQRWEKFGYKPFMTNMEATVEIKGFLE